VTNRPLVLIDVDGVLNVITSARERRRLCYHHGWQQKRVDVGGGSLRLFWNPDSGPMLRHLAEETGAELAWGTTWEEYANLVIGPLVGLPELPVCPVAGFPHKANGIVPWTAGRPFVWFDDEPDAAEVTAALAGSQPHLVIRTDEREGLTEGHVDAARDWLLKLGREVPGA
jgi:HAD domain in Swiss Army Knife RNA repair proteins